MRAPFLFLVVAVASSWCSAQVQDESLFTLTGSDVQIVVTKTGVPFDQVEVTIIQEDYPPELLRQQIAALGTRLSSEIRGLVIEHKDLGGDRPLRFLRAQLGAFGIADAATGSVRLQPVAQAFAGAPDPHAVDAVALNVVGMTPTAQTLRAYANDSAAVEGRWNSNPPFLEYMVLLRTQDPDKIEIPDSLVREAPKEPAPRKGEGLPTGILAAIVVVGALAVGALVYFAVLGSGSKR